MHKRLQELLHFTLEWVIKTFMKDCVNSYYKKELFMISLLWFFWRVACPLAWWLLSWRGWRRGWCPRRVKRGKPQQPPGERGQQMTGISSLPWTLGRSLLRVFGMGAFWWGVQLIFGIFWFLWERQFLVCISFERWIK